MYPDTDSPYLPVTGERIERIRSLMPEPPWVREARYEALGLPEDVIRLLAVSPKASLFERLTGELGLPPMLAATTLTRTFKALKRGGLEVERIPEGRLLELFSALKAGSFFREGMADVLSLLAEEPELEPLDALSRLGLRPLSREELEALLDAAVTEHGEAPMHNPEKRHHFLMGIVMRKAGGRCAGREVAEALARRLGGREVITSSESL